VGCGAGFVCGEDAEGVVVSWGELFAGLGEEEGWEGEGEREGTVGGDAV